MTSDEGLSELFSEKQACPTKQVDANAGGHVHVCGKTEHDSGVHICNADGHVWMTGYPTDEAHATQVLYKAMYACWQAKCICGWSLFTHTQTAGNQHAVAHQVRLPRVRLRSLPDPEGSLWDG